jgi:hypothetical protein
LVTSITPFCTTTLTDAANGATIALGVTGSTSLFVAATDTDLVLTDTFWVDTVPDAAGVAQPAATLNVSIAANIIGTVAVEAVTGGVLQIVVFWRPVSAGATLVAA